MHHKQKFELNIFQQPTGLDNSLNVGVSQEAGSIYKYNFLQQNNASDSSGGLILDLSQKNQNSFKTQNQNSVILKPLKQIKGGLAQENKGGGFNRSVT